MLVRFYNEMIRSMMVCVVVAVSDPVSLVQLAFLARWWDAVG